MKFQIIFYTVSAILSILFGFVSYLEGSTVGPYVGVLGCLTSIEVIRLNYSKDEK